MLILFSLTQTIKAQEQAKTYHEQMKIMMSELDNNRFANNTLYDKVYPLANLRTFNQEERKDTSNYKHFIQAVHELHLAGDRQVIRSSQDIEQSMQSLKMDNKVLVGIINMDISHIRADAFDDTNSKMYIDSTDSVKKMHEITAKEPYQTLQTLVISPLVAEVKQYEGTPVTFNFLQAMIQKSTNPIKTLNVDFGNGVNQNIITERRIEQIERSYTFTSGGVHTLRFSGTFQDDTTFETFGTISVTPPCPPPPGGDDEIKFIRATETFTPYIPDTEIPATGFVTNYPDPDSDDYISELPRINYKVIYSSVISEEDKILKPIIIVDGIDYNGSDNRDIDQIYNQELVLTDTGEKLGIKLLNRGYDVIIVDFPVYEIGKEEVMHVIQYDDYNNPEDWEMVEEKVIRKGGADYIQRDAQALKELIRYVNTELVANESNEKLVVMGPSMGALVTRWALREMELNGEDHNTRLWVSFDGPHQGANGPMSVQYSATFMDDYAGLDPLSRSASRQMLVQHFADAEIIPPSNVVVSHGMPGFRNRFNDELDALEYPNNLIRVALVNGTTTGEINNEVGQKIVDLDLWMDSFPWWYAGFVELYFSNNNGLNTVFHGRRRTGLMSWTENIGSVQTDSNIGSYDTAPGGKMDISGMFTNHEMDNVDNSLWIWLDGDLEQYVDSFTFMPTKSTLDFRGTNKKLRDPFCYDLVAAEETPFDTYYAPEHNEPHVQLNTANTTWLLEQLDAPEGEVISPQTYCEDENAGIESCPSFSYEVVDGSNPDIFLNAIGLPFSEQDIIDVSWSLDISTDGIIESTGQYSANIIPNPHTFGDITGSVSLTNSFGSSNIHFQVTIPPCANGELSIQPVGNNDNLFSVIDPCEPDEPLYIDSSELYDVYGLKLQDLNPSDDKIDVDNGDSGEIRIIKVEVNGKTATKRIIVK